MKKLSGKIFPIDQYGQYGQYAQCKQCGQRGQGMMEYVIIVAMIAVAAIGVYSVFGQTIRNQTSGLANEVAGKPAAAQIQAAGTTAQTAATRANAKKGMSEYNKDNDAGGQ